MAFKPLNDSINQFSVGTLFLVGTVIDNNDPLGLDRIKVRVPELYEPDRGNVPWCLPIKRSPFGQGSNYGVYGVPSIGSRVCIQIQQNDYDYPVYTGDLPVSQGSGFNNPNLWGFIDTSGNKLVVDKGSNKWEFTHSGGTVITVDSNGTKIVTSGDITSQSNSLNATANNAKVDCPFTEFTGTVKANVINATNSLTVAGIEMKTHVHGGVDRGNSSTDGPH